jgi:hypothetical protein
MIRGAVLFYLFQTLMVSSVMAAAYNETLAQNSVYYSFATHCEVRVQNWKCGEACSKVPGVV